MKKKKKILVITTYKNKLLKFEFLDPILNILNEINSKYEIFSLFEDMNKIEISKFNAVIFTGTAIKDFEYDSIEITQFLNTLANRNIPSIGICSGAQIISKYLNLNLIESKNIGIYELYNTKNDEIIKSYLLHSKTLNFEEYKNNTKLQIKYILKERKEENNWLIEYLILSNFHLFFFHPEIKNKELIKNILNFK